MDEYESELERLDRAVVQTASGLDNELLLALLGHLGRVGERPADFAAHAGADARGFVSAYLEQRFPQLRGWGQLFRGRVPRGAGRPRAALGPGRADGARLPGG